ncbi:ABC transporter ATP-binding protein [Roseiarcaceae bacterium H3SJ34-1]|uniref:ABC transporter ATP-binding protein n=1 Tax=Terripilifer ovatus TaxID=3032367 RepID=UPI003AB94995|nr:ABC transporter ATP-binding protein [Roseiarcaceae bacterium H3SJ34-1]
MNARPRLVETDHSATAHVAFRSVSHTYPARAGHPPVHALGPLDFNLNRGEFLSVVGPSGCGKTTLLEVLAGLVKPEGGTIEIDGRAMTGDVPDGVGVVFQEDASFPWLTVADNVAFGLRRAGLPAKEIAGRVDYALDFMGLNQFRTAYPSQLSGGMRQRVCIARTLVTRPSLILLDEPFGALDQQTRLLMGEELLKLWRETGATVMLITHSLDEAAMLADRVAVMSARPGRFIDIIETRWPRERDSSLASQPEFGVLTSRLWSLLREESRKAMESSGARSSGATAR